MTTLSKTLHSCYHDIHPTVVWSMSYDQMVLNLIFSMSLANAKSVYLDVSLLKFKLNSFVIYGVMEKITSFDDVASNMLMVLHHILDNSDVSDFVTPIKKLPDGPFSLSVYVDSKKHDLKNDLDGPFN